MFVSTKPRFEASGESVTSGAWEFSFVHVFVVSPRDRHGPVWTGSEVFDNFEDTKDYLGIIFPIAIAAVGLSLMSLVSAKTAGTMHDASVNRLEFACLWYVCSVPGRTLT